MKRIIAATTVFIMLFNLCACGNTVHSQGAAPTEGASIADEIPDVQSEDVPVDIYLSIADFDNIGAEAYLEKLKQEHPDNQYRYYNEQYYIQTITEGARKAFLEYFTDADAIFTEAFEANYPGMFIKAELNSSMNEVTLHLSRDIYDSDLFAGFTVLLVGVAYLDSLQAYNLVPPESRDARLVCVDETGAILIDSDKLEN